MSDWQIGDLAVNVDNADDCPGCSENIGTEWDGCGAPFSGVAEVVGVIPPDFEGDTCSLQFAGDPADEGWCSCGFRKVVRDKHEACEPEFVTLLKRAKRPVSA